MRHSLITHLSYVFVGILSILLAVFITVRFVKPAQSETAKANRSVTQAQPAPNSNLKNNNVGSAVVNDTVTGDPNVTGAAIETIPTGLGGTAPIDSKDDASTGASAPMPVSADSISFLEPYIFDVREGRRNPFKPPLLEDGSLPDVILPGTPLERYDLDELKLVGIMWDIAKPKAMVIDPLGEVYVLGKEDRIGRKRGYIAVIRESEVVVVEASDFDGENTYSTRILRIDK